MAANVMTKLTKNKYIPFMDVSKTYNALDTTSWQPSWKRIDLSTIFSINPNPQTQSMDYISYETPVEEIEKYAPELPMEIALYDKHPVYEFVFDLFFNLAVGPEAKVPILMCFGGTDKKAWQIKECTLVLGELNTVDNKLSFTLKLGGTYDRGTYAISADGVPSFSE